MDGHLLQPGNIFASIPDNLQQEVLEQIVHAGQVKIERIISQGHTSPESGWYDQEQGEWVILLQGGAKIAFEDGSETELTAGDYINIPAHTRHRVSWTDPETETIWLAVHY